MGRILPLSLHRMTVALVVACLMLAVWPTPASAAISEEAFEACLLEHPSVREVAIVGVPDDDLPFEADTKPVDDRSPVIVRDPDRCIVCGRCVRLCEEVQGIAAIGFVKAASSGVA